MHELCTTCGDDYAICKCFKLDLEPLRKYRPPQPPSEDIYQAFVNTNIPVGHWNTWTDAVKWAVAYMEGK